MSLDFGPVNMHKIQWFQKSQQKQRETMMTLNRSVIMIGLGGGIELGNPSFYIVQFLALPAKARILCLDSL